MQPSLGKPDYRGRGENQPRWLVHNEAEPRVRNREVVQRVVVAFHKPPSQDKESSTHGNPPPQALGACLAAKSSLSRL